MRNSRIGISSSPSLRSGLRTFVVACRRKSAIFTPGIAIGRWKAMKDPAELVRRVDISSTSSPFSSMRPAGHLVARVTHDGQAQRALARTVGSHQRVRLAALDLQVRRRAGSACPRPHTCRVDDLERVCHASFRHGVWYNTCPVGLLSLRYLTGNLLMIRNRLQIGRCVDVTAVVRHGQLVVDLVPNAPNPWPYRVAWRSDGR